MQKLKQNRLASFIVLALVYIVAASIGIIIYRNVKLEWWLSLLIVDVIATIVIFIFGLIFKNASVYDPYWSVQPPVILLGFAACNKLSLFSILLLVVVFYWAIRLTANWAYTFKNLNHQDWRYSMLNEKTKRFYPIINFIGIHMVPTLVVYGCVLPAVYAIRNRLTLNLFSFLFLFLSITAATIQAIADIQMHKFRKNKNSIFIRNGLWKHSRHPNYLGEILMWWGVGLAVLFADLSVWYLLCGALANTMLFLAVSIPLADGRQSRKEGFGEYKIQTRMLFPIKKLKNKCC